MIISSRRGHLHKATQTYVNCRDRQILQSCKRHTLVHNELNCIQKDSINSTSYTGILDHLKPRWADCRMEVFTSNIPRSFCDVSLTIPLFVISIITLVIFLVYERIRHFRTFSKYGILGPKPSFWNGNMTRLRKTTPLEAMQIWGKKYGKIYGYFAGTRATLVISEVDLVREILVKNNKNFADRPPLIVKMEPVSDTLVGLRGAQWGRVRSLLSPVFSKSNLRQMGGKMGICVKVTGSILEAKMGESKKVEVDVWKLFQGLTCDVISRCALAMEVNSQHDNDGDEFLGAVRGFLKNAINPFIVLALCFPSVAKMAELGMKVFSVSHVMTRMIVDSVRQALEERRQPEWKQNNNNAHVDVLQFMMDSGKLSDREILANAWVFILGGFETTASALTFSTYLLAKHQDVQARLANELEKVFGDEVPSFDQINGIEYLDQVISECLRLYPPIVTFVSRYVQDDVNLGGIHLRSGSTVQVPVWEIHHDPELWPNPEHFDPERFSRIGKVERHPMAFMPFGAGPRACVGTRFALAETKIALAYIFRRFRVYPPPIGWEPKLAVPTVALVPAEEIRLTFSMRRDL